MTLVYVVGKGSKHDNVELRWSLRSVAKYAMDVERVIVVGYPPEFLSDDVERLAVPDIDLPGSKNRSIVNCVLEAVRAFALKGEFIFACDDVFLTAPTYFIRWPYFVDADGLPEFPSPDRSGAFEHLLIATRKFLLDHGAPCFRFQTHSFCRMDADVIKANEDLLRSTIYDSVRGLEILSLAGNLRLKADLTTPLFWRKDVKFGADDFSLRTIADPRRHGAFSVSDKTFGNDVFMRFMDGEFGSPCKYERS